MSVLSNFLGIILLSCIVILTISNIKGRTKLILVHPLIAILAGLIVFTVLARSFNGLFDYSNYQYLLTFVIPLFTGGYVATGLSKNNNTINGLSEGVIFIVLILVGLLNGVQHINLIRVVASFSFILISAGIGGYTAKKLKEYVINKQILSNNI